MIDPITKILFDAVADSMIEFRKRITNVRWGRFEQEINYINFEFDNQTYEAELCPPFNQILIGFNYEADKKLVGRLFLDGKATKI